jgi:hypothetical protein
MELPESICYRGWVDPRADLDGVVKRQISQPPAGK